jgi:hypothetical protein
LVELRVGNDLDVAAPAAVGYYARIGLRRHDSAWCLAPDEKVSGQ